MTPVNYAILSVPTSYSQCSDQSSQLLRRQRLNIPDHLRILLDAPVAAEEAHPRHACDTLAHPLILIFVRFINHFLRLDVAAEIVADQIVIAMVNDAVAKGVEAGGVTKGAGTDSIEDL